MTKDDYEGVLTARFASRLAATPTMPRSAQPTTAAFGTVDRTERKTRERKSTRTQAQRERTKKRTKMVNFKTTPETKALLSKLAKARGMSMTALIELGICLVARQSITDTGAKDV
jgi:uncharacterized protein (DUF1778 family)